MQVLTFTAAAAQWAIPMDRVIRVLGSREIEPPAEAWGPEPDLGFPTLDMARCLGLGETAFSARTCVLLVEAARGSARTRFGLLADEVRGVVNLGDVDLRAPPSASAGAPLLGIGRTDRGLHLLLDVDRVAASMVLRPRTVALA